VADTARHGFGCGGADVTEGLQIDALPSMVEAQNDRELPHIGARSENWALEGWRDYGCREDKR
jgi:hypothetical protein